MIKFFVVIALMLVSPKLVNAQSATDILDKAKNVQVKETITQDKSKITPPKKLMDGKSIDDPTLCIKALDINFFRYSTRSSDRLYVDEAKRRGLSEENCKFLTRKNKIEVETTAKSSSDVSTKIDTSADQGGKKTSTELEKAESKALLNEIEDFSKKGTFSIDSLELAKKILVLKNELLGADIGKLTLAKNSLKDFVFKDSGFKNFDESLIEARKLADKSVIDAARKRSEALISVSENYIRKNVSSDGAAFLIPLINDLKSAMDSPSVTVILENSAKVEKQLVALNIPLPEQLAASDLAEAAKSAAASKKSELELQIEETNNLLNIVSNFTANEKVSIDIIELSTTVGKLKKAVRDGKPASISEAKSGLENLITKDAGFLDYKNRLANASKLSEKAALNFETERANTLIEFIKGFISKNLTSDQAIALVEPMGHMSKELQSPTLAPLKAANDLAFEKIKEFKLSNDFANFVPASQRELKASVPQDIKATSKNKFVMEGAENDVVIIYNAAKTAPHAIINIRGVLAFEGNQANVCWYQSKLPSVEVKRQTLQSINKLGATILSDPKILCELSSLSKYDLIMFERLAFLNNKIELDLVLIDEIEKNNFKQALTLQGSDIANELGKRQALSEKLESDVEKDLRTGFGVVRILNDSRTICGSVDRLQDGHLRLLRGKTSEFTDELNGRPTFSEILVEQAFVSSKKGQCGLIYANATDLKSTLIGLRRDGVPYRVLPIWFDTKDVDAADAEVQAEKLLISQSEEKQKQQISDELAQAEAQQNTAEAIRARMQEQLRKTYGTTAKASSDELGEWLTDNINKGAVGTEAIKNAFPSYANWFADRLSKQWEVSNTKFELYDYGTASWNDRRIDAVFIKYEIKIKNRIIGKYEDRCSIIGWITDTEFAMNRDPFEVDCDKAEISLVDWERKRAFEERWIVRQ
jgi:hypothetical protein